MTTTDAIYPQGHLNLPNGVLERRSTEHILEVVDRLMELRAVKSLSDSAAMALAERRVTLNRDGFG